MSIADRMAGAIQRLSLAQSNLFPRLVAPGGLTAEQTRLRDDYLRKREVAKVLANQLAGKIPKNVLDQCAKKLGLWVRGTLVFDDMNETTILMDYCIYDGLVDGKSVARRFLETDPYPAGSDQAVQLEAMSRARFRLIAVTKTMPDFGVEIIDLLRNETRLLIDIGFSHSAVGGMILASRTVDFPEFSMTTGAALPITGESLETIHHLLKTSARPLLALDPENMSKEDEGALSTLILRAGLAARGASRIRYQGTDEGENDLVTTDEGPGGWAPPRLGPARQPLPPRISPNDLCPCGSNRKFKKCCGRPRR